MTLRQTVKTFWKHNKLAGLLFFFPIHIVRGKVFIMLPYWYNGNFSMRSLNKWRD